MSSRILVIGASGGVAKLVISNLLSLSSPSFTLRVSSRNPDEKLTSLPSSVEVVKANLDDPSCYPSLFEGVTKVFLYIQGTYNTLDALLESIKAHNVQHIVFLSTLAVSEPSSFVGKIHKRVEDAISASGITFTFLRPGVFNSNCIRVWGPQIRQNVVCVPFLESFSAPIANEDIADVASLALTSNNLNNQSILLTGPHSLSQKEQIEIISKVRKEVVEGGKEVEGKQVEAEEWKKTISPHMPVPVADSLIELWKSTVGVKQEVHDSKRLTGKSMSFEEWTRVHADELFL